MIPENEIHRDLLIQPSTVMHSLDISKQAIFNNSLKLFPGILTLLNLKINSWVAAVPPPTNPSPPSPPFHQSDILDYESQCSRMGKEDAVFHCQSGGAGVGKWAAVAAKG
jgi:hypothetical protein